MSEVRLRARADLTAEQKRAVWLDYGLEGQDSCFETRRALEISIEQRWGLISLAPDWNAIERATGDDVIVNPRERATPVDAPTIAEARNQSQ